MRRIVKSLKPLAEEKKIDFEVLLPEDVFATVDADKLWEAIYNIVDNSIKYTGENGWVYVEMYRDKQEVYITVADNGIGMQEEETEKIFDRFYRVDKARARETGGTGLGLSIAQSSIELHGGKIYVESREDVGSLFRIIIPTGFVPSLYRSVSAFLWLDASLVSKTPFCVLLNSGTSDVL
jgi:signal transduction histidine kinase